MNIGKRLRAMREAKRLSQGDIERGSGLLRSYISRVEGGYTSPSLSTLERFAKALRIEPYQLLFAKPGRPQRLALGDHSPVSRSASRLIKLFESMPAGNRKLLMVIASKLAKR